MDPVIALLSDLVAIDSVNPVLAPGARGEAEVAHRLAAELRAVGLTVHITEVTPGRPNVVGVLDGRRPGRSLMLCGHTDTVGKTEFNDALSLRRAERVRKDFVDRGIPTHTVNVAGRGEREPFVPTADEVNEPRNRRVEINVR